MRLLAIEFHESMNRQLARSPLLVVARHRKQDPQFLGKALLRPALSGWLPCRPPFCSWTDSDLPLPSGGPEADGWATSPAFAYR